MLSVCVGYLFVCVFAVLGFVLMLLGLVYLIDLLCFRFVGVLLRFLE